jgi:putative phosphoesterase
MKFLLMSDTHGRTGLAAAVINAVRDVDHIVHMGDMAADAARISEAAGVFIISVRGNCDGDFSNENYKIIKTACGNILVVHGHRENVKSGLQNLYYRAVELECKAAFYGHTHVARIDEKQGVTLVNPGSLSLPARGAPPSYAVAEFDEKGISASLIFVTPDFENFPERETEDKK